MNPPRTKMSNVFIAPGLCNNGPGVRVRMGVPVSVSETSMTVSVLIINPDADRAQHIGRFVVDAGGRFSIRSSISERGAADPEFTPDIVLISSAAINDLWGDPPDDIRTHFSAASVLIGMIDSATFSVATLFGAGLDLVLHEPIGPADLKRVLAFATQIRSEHPELTQERCRRLMALHQLAIQISRDTSDRNWIERIVVSGHHVLKPDALAMWVPDRSSQQLRCVGSVGLPATYVEAAEKNSARLFADYELYPVEIASNWLLSDTVPVDPNIVAPDDASVVGIERIAWMPVRDANRIYGHLSFYFMGGADYRQYDLILADAFASIVASALNTYRLQTEIRRSNRMYREQVEMSPNGLMICQPNGVIERANSAMSRISGRNRLELLGQSVFDLFLDPDNLEGSWETWLSIDPNQSPEPVELWVRRSDSARRRVNCLARRIILPDTIGLNAAEERMQLVFEDVTDQARRLLELELFHDLSRHISSQGSIDDAFELVADRLFNLLRYRIVWIGEVHDGFRIHSRVFRSVDSSVPVPSYLDSSMGIVGRAVRENRSILVPDVQSNAEYVAIDRSVHSELASVIRVDGRPVAVIDVQTDESQILDSDDLNMVESITAHLGLLIEQVSVHERLERQALTDSLTGIANRRAFMRDLEQLVSDRRAGTAGLFLIELDHFKQINDRFGHLFGDEMLRQVSKRLQDVLRADDLLARYGGDELAVISREMDPSKAREIAHRLQRAVSSTPFRYGEISTTITVSVGIAIFPDHGRTTDALIGEADRAMYKAKLDGRNSVYGAI